VRPSLLFTLRTANRAPKANYLARTVQSLWTAGVPSDQIHVFPTDPDVSWMPELPGVHVHIPEATRTPNMNGIAPIALLDSVHADWIVLSEDDLQWCDEPIDAMARWLADYAKPDVMVYRFFAFDRLTRLGGYVASVPLREHKGSQVVVLRAADARRFAAWATANSKHWRPRGAPFQDQPDNGFDKLVGYWALQDRPTVDYGFVSYPFFVKHIGTDSSLHRVGITRDGSFRQKPYEVPTCA
jgi:hypothetical protein